MPLHLHNSLGVKPYGVSGILYVKCIECGNVARVKLRKTHHVNDRRKGVGTFDVNTKTAAGMIHAGIGETQLNNLFAAMNVHCPHHKSIKERENEVGDIMEKHAVASEKRFLLDEAFQSMTIDSEGNEQGGINVSTDACWQKKVQAELITVYQADETYGRKTVSDETVENLKKGQAENQRFEHCLIMNQDKNILFKKFIDYGFGFGLDDE